MYSWAVCSVFIETIINNQDKRCTLVLLEISMQAPGELLTVDLNASNLSGRWRVYCSLFSRVRDTSGTLKLNG